jgi:hypothetical protein
MDQLGNKSNSGPKFESAVVSALGIIPSLTMTIMIGMSRSLVFVKQLELIQK